MHLPLLAVVKYCNIFFINCQLAQCLHYLFIIFMFFEKLLRKMLSLQHARRQKLLMTKKWFDHNNGRKHFRNKLLYCVCMMFVKTDSSSFLFFLDSNKRDWDQTVTNTAETKRRPRPGQIPHRRAHSKMLNLQTGGILEIDLTVHTGIASCICACTRAPLEMSWWNKQKSFYFVFSK